MENTEKSKLNSEMIWKIYENGIWKKGKLNCEMVQKIWKNSKLKS